jgi:hypothetical protein
MTDASGNLYLSGIYSSTADFDPNGTNPASTHVLTATLANGDGFVAKYLANGTFQWVTDVGGAASSRDVAASGSAVYASFSTLSSGGVVRLDPTSGTVLWNTIVAAGVTTGLAVDPGGNVDVAGSSAGHQFVSQLDSAGNVRWTNTSTGGNGAGAGGIAVDGSGNVFTTGGFTGTVAFGTTTLTSMSASPDVFVWKLNAAGGSVWAGSMGSTGGDYGTAIAVDTSGSVAITGSFEGSMNNFNPGSGKPASLPYHGSYFDDIFIVKLTAGRNGAMQLGWAKDIGGSSEDVGNGVAFDSTGNVIRRAMSTQPEFSMVR